MYDAFPEALERTLTDSGKSAYTTVTPVNKKLRRVRVYVIFFQGAQITISARGHHLRTPLWKVISLSL
jgi:hypothetical protein